MKILFTKIAIEEYELWEIEDPDIFEKIGDLIEDIKKTPFTGLGKPEPLKHALKGYWSRRITHEHRLVYTVKGKKGIDQACTIIQCRFHY